MEELNDPCGEQNSIPTAPLWNIFSTDYGDVKYLRKYRFSPSGAYHGAFTEMYFAPKSPIDRPMLIIRFGSGKGEARSVPLNRNPLEEISDYRGDPEMKQAFEIAYSCAKQKKYVGEDIPPEMPVMTLITGVPS